MPNPITIEELIEMDACPVADGQLITHDLLDALEDLPMTDPVRTSLFEAQTANTPFKMPDGYYYLPPDKQLGLPLGEWTYNELKSLVDVLPYGVFEKYCYNNKIANTLHWSHTISGGCFCATDFCEVHATHWDKNGGNKYIILKQPSNLYCPLDQQAEVLMENNSANETQPAKETEKMELPWQDISEMPVFTEDLGSFVLCRRGVLEFYSDPELIDLEGVTKFLLLTPPEAPTIEPPVEPERVSLQEFAKDPACKWVNTSDGCPIKGWYQIQKEGEGVMGLPFKLWDIAKKDHPIYATDPTAWLASQAEQEGKSE